MTSIWAKGQISFETSFLKATAKVPKALEDDKWSDWPYPWREIHSI